MDAQPSIFCSSSAKHQPVIDISTPELMRYYLSRPGRYDPKTGHINLSGMRLIRVSAEALKVLQWINTRSWNLSDNPIKQLPETIFTKLLDLAKLDIRKTNIRPKDLPELHESHMVIPMIVCDAGSFAHPGYTARPCSLDSGFTDS